MIRLRFPVYAFKSSSRVWALSEKVYRNSLMVHTCVVLPKRFSSRLDADRRLNRDVPINKLPLSRAVPLAERIAAVKHVLLGTASVDETIISECNAVLKRVVRADDLNMLVDLVKLFMSKGIALSPGNVKYVLERVSQTKNFKLSAEIVDFTLSKSFSPDAHVWNLKITELLHAPDIDTNTDKVMQVCVLVDQLHSHKLQLHSRVYSRLLRTLVDHEMEAGALQLWDFLIDNKVEFNGFMFSSMVRLLSCSGRVSEAEAVLRTAHQQCFGVDRAALVSFLTALAGEPSLLPFNTENEGTTVAATTTTAASAVTTLQHVIATRDKECSTAYRTLLQHNHTSESTLSSYPYVDYDAAVYRAMLQLFAKHGDTVSAEFLYWEVVHRQLRVDRKKLFLSLLTAYRNHILLLSLRSSDPTNKVERGRAAGGLSEREAKSVRKVLLNKRDFLSPNVFLVDFRLTRSHNNNNNNNNNKVVHGQFPSIDDTLVYRAVDVSLSAADCHHRMRLIYNELVLGDKLVPDNHILQQCLLGAILVNQVDLALAVFEGEYARHGVSRGHTEYSYMMSMFNKLGDSASALRLYSQAQAEGVMPLLASYSEYQLFADYSVKG